MSSSRLPHLFGIVLCGMLSLAAVGTQAQTAWPSPSPSPSPTQVTSKEPTLESQFFKNILRDQKAIWTSPFNLHGRDARWLAPLAVGTGLLIATDRITGDKIGEHRGQLNASRIISYAGSVYGVSGIAATFYLVGRAKHNYRARETGVLGAEALFDSLIVVNALKGITQRARPLAGKERSEFFERGTSFPSGHAMTSFALATVIASEYHDHRLVQVAAYGIASAVSLSRFTGRKHYLSDVIVGGAIGYGIGKYVYRAHHLTKAGSDEEESRRRATLFPLIAPQYNRRAREYGVELAWTF